MLDGSDTSWTTDLLTRSMSVSRTTARVTRPVRVAIALITQSDMDRRMPARKSEADKLLGKVTPGPRGCMIWTGCLSTTGYGRVSWGAPRRTEYAHRASFETFNRVLEDGEVIDHVCGERRCINPLHLEAVTRLENNHRGGNNGTAWCGRYGHNEKYCSDRCQHKPVKEGQIVSG